MKSKKKKRLLILIGIVMICLLPISLLSKVLVPWAEELGEVTTEAGAAPPGDATVTDASLEEEIPMLEYRYSYSQFATQNAFLRYAYDGVWKPATSSAYGDGKGTGNHCAEYVGAVLQGWYTAEKAPTAGKATVSELRQALVNSGYWTEVYANVNTFVNCTQSEAGYDAVLASIGVQPGDVLCFVRNSLEYGHAEHAGIYGGTTTSGTAILLEQSNSAGWHAERAGAYIDNARSAGTSADKYCTGVVVLRYIEATDSALRVCKMPYYGGADVESLVANNPEYNTVKGAVYAVYSDAALHNVVGYCIQDDDNDNVSTNMRKTPDVNGEEVKITSNGTYYLKETKAPDNGVMSLSSNVYSFYVDVTKGRHTIGVPYSFENKSKLNLVSSQPGVYNENPTLVSGTNHNQPGVIDDANYGHVALKKTSSNPTCTNNNPLYDLAGTQYTVYNEDGVTVAKTVSGNNAVLTCNSAGNTNTLEMPIGKYVVKETKAGKGYQLNKSTMAIELTASNTVDNPYIINTTDKPVDDPISVALTKENNNKVPIKGAVYCIEYYPGIQTYSESEAQTKHTGSVSKWYFETDANGEVVFLTSPTAAGYSSSPFFIGALGGRTIPLGTVIMYEEKAPDNYTKSDKHWVFQVRQASDDLAYMYGMDGNTEKCYDGVNVSDTNAPKFTDTPIPVNLTVQKKNGNPTPQQGSTGDVTLEGAVFALYAQRDVVDTATGEIKARDEKYTVNTPLTHKDGTPVIDPTTGKQVIAKAGDSKPLQISETTGVDGKITFKDIFTAKNADDYYVVELCAPKDFYRDKAEHSVDLRDNRTDAEKSNVNYTALSKHLDVTDQPIMQPIHVKKYTPVKVGNTTEIKPLNGAGFSVYLISSLKGDVSSCKIMNADGSISYNFKSYDFSNETGEVVTDDGERVLVTGSGDNDDGEVTSIDTI